MSWTLALLACLEIWTDQKHEAIIPEVANGTALTLSLNIAGYNQTDKRVPVKLKWTKVPNALFYRVFKRKPGGEWQSISTFDYADGESVSVLNAYPSYKAGPMWCNSITYSDFVWADGRSAHIETSASLKVWMEGGKKDGTRFENVGWNPVKHEQAIKVDVITVDQLNAAKSRIWDYDIVVFGTWDGAGTDYNTRTVNYPNAGLTNEIENYIKAGYGVVASHDFLGAISGTDKGLAPLRDYFGIKIGSGVGRPYDFPSFWDLWSSEIQVVKEGFLTKFPFEIDGKRLTVPLTHTHGNMAFGDVWINFLDIRYSIGNPAAVDAAWKYGGNPVYYLTTKGNTAMIQTGHSNCQSTFDERKVWANTLFYLKQRTDKTERIDNSGYDLYSPKKPSCEIENEYNHADFFCSSNDIADPCEYRVLAFARDEPYSVVAESPVQRIDITSGVSHFVFKVDQFADTTIFSNTTGTFRSTGGIARIDKKSTAMYLHVAAVDRVGNIGPTKTYIVGVISPSPTFSALPLPQSQSSFTGGLMVLYSALHVS